MARIHRSSTYNGLTSPERPETPAEPFADIPFGPNPDFVDRGDILKEIDERCSKPAGRVALVGLGGAGKSQLAIQFAHRINDTQIDTWVFWVYAASLARVEQAFRDIADNIKLRDRKQPGANIYKLVSRWLSNRRNGKWVMIIDSADDYDMFYGEPKDGRKVQPLWSYIPQSSHGCILLTTRSEKLGSELAGGHQNVIKVGAMDHTEAFSLLGKKLGPITDRSTATHIIDQLNGIPLAITQAAAYIAQYTPRMSLCQYLAELRGGEDRTRLLLSQTVKDLYRDIGQSNAVLQTGLMSIEQICRERRSAIDLLSLMSFFDPQSIPASIVESAKEAKNMTTTSTSKQPYTMDGII